MANPGRVPEQVFSLREVQNRFQHPMRKVLTQAEKERVMRMKWKKKKKVKRKRRKGGRGGKRY